MVHIQIVNDKPRGPHICFRLPEEQDGFVIMQIEKALAELDLGGLFTFRLRYGKIQVQRYRPKNNSPGGRGWVLLGTEKRLPARYYGRS